MSGGLIHHHMVSVNFWTVNVSGTNRLKAHRSSDVCSELTQATHAQKGTQADKFTMASA